MLQYIICSIKNSPLTFIDLTIFKKITWRKPCVKGKLASFIFFISLFTIMPFILRLMLPKFLEIFTTQYSRFCAMIILTNVLIFGMYNLVMYIIYTIKHPFFEQYRCTDKPWPWESDPDQWRKQLRKSCIIVFFNMIIINALFPLLQIALGGIKYKHSLQEIPNGSTIFFQFIVSMILQDTLFYWTHYSLHSPSLYWIHKTHHDYKTTIALAATSTHPLEYIYSAAIPTGIGMSLLSGIMPVHFISAEIWYIYRAIDACQGHCGYQWSWSLLSFVPFRLHPDYHSFHHTHNVGNFGSVFGFWDHFMGTNKQYVNYTNKLSADKYPQVITNEKLD